MNLRYRQILNRILDTKPLDIRNPNSAFEIHTLTSAKDYQFCLWSLKSFIRFSRLVPNVYIHDDGTLTDSDRADILDHIRGVKLITCADADKLVLPKLGKYPNSLRYRSTNSFGKKLFDVYFYAKEEKLMILDSDILFFKQPNEIVDWVNNPQNMSVLYNYDPIDTEVKVREKIKKGLGINYMFGYNAGLQCLLLKVFNLNQIETYLAYMYRNSMVDWVTEQRGMSILVTKYGLHWPLPREKYFFQNRRNAYYQNRNLDTFPNSTIVKHYSRYARNLFITEGIFKLGNSLI